MSERARTGLLALAITGVPFTAFAVACLVAIQADTTRRRADQAGRTPVAAHASPEAAPAPSADATTAELLRHPWWRGRVSAAALEQILRHLTTHGEGTVLFNPDGQSVWLSASRVGRPRSFGQIELTTFHNLARQTPEVGPLGERVKFCPITAGVGQRMSRQEAIVALQDFLNLPDRAELFDKGSRALDDFLRMAEEASPGRRPDVQPPAK
jgi:hypothetical protein